MPAKIVVGAQWGDEGKGKTIDILASRADVVVRSQGGSNAGHTVESGGKVYKLHLIPSGILYRGTLCLIGCGVVLDPKCILEEIDSLESRSVSCDNLRIDLRTHIVMPWHFELDGLSESARGGSDIGTTRRGIGPCYMDKAERSGIRFYDLIHPEVLREKARAAGEAKNKIIVGVYGGEPLNIDAVIEEYTEYGRRLRKYAGDASVLTYDAVKAGKNVLFEGAQGALLDIDLGTYPYVTSSHPISGGCCTGTGIGPTCIDEVIGVAKAYTTRVGKGPFPTELNDDMGDLIRNRGHEFGTTTGRPRRTGWFDAVIVRHAVRINGLTSLVVNKLDTLADIDTLRICTAYKLPDGSITRDFPATLEELAGCEPVYEDHAGFRGDVSSCKTYAELPEAAKAYVDAMEKAVGCRISTVGIGPGREQNLDR